MRADELREILKKHKSQPVGNGFIDCITLWDDVEALVDELTEKNIRITGCTWWCHCTPLNKEKLSCPHGMGGPQSKYHEGWFSEGQMPMTEFKENSEILPYLHEVLPTEQWYSPCLAPGFWILTEQG